MGPHHSWLKAGAGRTAAAALAISLHTGAARAQPADVDLELILAVDVSYSMDPAEQALQRQGYVEAFRHPQVIAAIAGGPLGRVAVTYVEWGGRAVQIVPWTMIDGLETAERFAAMLAEQPVQRISFTSISNALLFSRRLFRENDFRGLRRVIDISGDGPNNGGAPAPLARDTALREGIVIDGLPVMLEGARPDAAAIPDLDEYYENCVIGGPGAFVMKVTRADEFAEAIRRKLILEITGPKLASGGDVRPIPAAFPAKPPYDCLIGEKLHETQAP
jgi:hypothetical protein